MIKLMVNAITGITLVSRRRLSNKTFLKSFMYDLAYPFLYMSTFRLLVSLIMILILQDETTLYDRNMYRKYLLEDAIQTEEKALKEKDDRHYDIVEIMI